MTDTGIAIYSLLMGVTENKLATPEAKNELVSILKLVRSLKPNLLAVDSIGRTCMHHAASVGNLTGIQFTVKLLDELFETEQGVNLSNGYHAPLVLQLINQQTIGGVTPLIRAAEALSTDTVNFLL